MRDVEKSPLKRVALLNMGQSPPSEDYNQAGLGLPFLQGNADFGARYPLATTFCKTPKKICQTGDLLVSVRAPVGALNSADQPYGIGRGLCAITSIPGRLDQTFLLWALEGTCSELHAVSTGSTYDAVDLDDLGSLRIPLPPLPTQRAIANFLDRKTAALDGLIARKERLLELLAERRAALIHRAVTRGLDPDVPLKDSGVPWIGEIPAHWEVKRLVWIVRPGTSIAYGIVQAGPDVEDGIPYIRVSEMVGSNLPQSGYLRTSPEIDASYKRSKVQAGDLVVALRSTIGKTLPVPDWLDGANLTQGTAKIAVGRGNSPAFIQMVMESSYSRQSLDAVSKGATFREITLESLRKHHVVLPPPDEQATIVNRMGPLLISLDTVRERVSAQLSRLREYRQALITAAVTGQLEIPEVPA